MKAGGLNNVGFVETRYIASLFRGFLGFGVGFRGFGGFCVGSEVGLLVWSCLGGGCLWGKEPDFRG